MASRLTVEYDQYKYLYFLAWSDEDGLGLYVESTEHLNVPEPKEREVWECWIAAKVASESPNVITHRESPTYFWGEESQAIAARKQANAAIKAGRGLPDWAKQAIAAGWKPPKGWNP